MYLTSINSVDLFYTFSARGIFTNERLTNGGGFGDAFIEVKVAYLTFTGIRTQKY